MQATLPCSAAELLNSYDGNGGALPEPSPPPCGCRELLWAVLRDLFVVRQLAVKGDQSDRLAAQVAADRQWLASDADYPFSLRWVCHHLGVEPGDVRRAYQAGVRVPGLWMN
jgi:hypothetical protein